MEASLRFEKASNSESAAAGTEAAAERIEAVDTADIEAAHFAQELHIADSAEAVNEHPAQPSDMPATGLLFPALAVDYGA